MTKAEVCKLLGVSEKTVERWVNQGVKRGGVTVKLPVSRERNTYGVQIVDIDPAALDEFNAIRLATDTDTPTPTDTDSEAGTSTALALTRPPALGQVTVAALAEAIGAAVAEAIASDRQRQTVPAPPIADLSAKLLLTPAEAARLAGVGVAAIDSAIAAGGLVAHYGTWRGRRLKRADVEKWVSKL